ncbi:MAG: hypothetical protein M1834_006816 [Cirrosporium novae-zelandiae]|nr:MAG: hypothetical protein M1834_006816 [Cirrosporium novae-zelandiae]
MVATDTSSPGTAYRGEFPNSTTSKPWTPPSAAPNSPRKSHPYTDWSNLPTGPKSLSGISLRAYLLGITTGTSILLTPYLLLQISTPLWRIPFFLLTLSLFHFLEYWTTAAYNTNYATVSAFLFSSNGSAYTIAHVSAFLECIFSHLCYPNLHFLPFPRNLSPALGILLIFAGQIVRTIAMMQAGESFNHTVQTSRKEGHVLVTRGIYAYFRHPSYFGYFWWALGTQIMLGNYACFVGFAVVLWRFFSGRIWSEERFLVGFFGDDYTNYRKRTPVGIPFIR